MVFQFHKGTIKTVRHGGVYVTIIIFQFHKGTIKTQKSSNCLLTLTNFNSIKVRLKLNKDTVIGKKVSTISIP